MDKKFTNLVKRLALHFGEQVVCEWLSPEDVEWVEWKNAEINSQFLIHLEKGNIRNIQIPQTSVTIQAELITTFNNFQEWQDKVSSDSTRFSHDGFVCVDQNGRILLSEEEFSFARDNEFFPVNVYRMLKNTEK